MDDSTLQSLIECLGAQRSEQVRHLNNWTWVVAFGVFFEFVFIIWDHLDDRTDWKYAVARFKIAFPSKPSVPKLVFELVSVGMVVGGIVGELNVEAKLGKLDNDIERANDNRVALLKGESDQLRLHASGLEKQAGELRKQAEGEALARANIEASTAFRQLSDAQKKDIGKSLAKYRNIAGASVWFEVSSAETELFADDIAGALKDAGIVVKPPTGLLSMRSGGNFNSPILGVETGVTVQSTNNSTAQELAKDLIAELTKRGFDAVRTKDPPFEKGSQPVIWVTVEMRPKGPQGEYKLQAEREAKQKIKK